MELYLKPQKTPNGKYAKGCIPFNKGKTWDFMGISKEKQAKIKKNLLKGAGKRNYPVFYNKVLMFKDDKIIGVFKGSNEAGKQTGIQPRNIRSVCNGKRKTAGGYVWKYEKNL